TGPDPWVAPVCEATDQKAATLLRAGFSLSTTAGQPASTIRHPFVRHKPAGIERRPRAGRCHAAERREHSLHTPGKTQAADLPTSRVCPALAPTEWTPYRPGGSACDGGLGSGVRQTSSSRGTGSLPGPAAFPGAPTRSAVRRADSSS